MSKVIFNISIRPRNGRTWPVAVEQRFGADRFPLGVQSSLVLDTTSLTALELDERAYGEALGRALFRDEIRDLLVDALSRSQGLLRIRLAVEDAELSRLAWSRLCAPLDGVWRVLALEQRLTFARLLTSRSTRIFPRLSARDMAALIVAASPHDLPRYGLALFEPSVITAPLYTVLAGLPVTALVTGNPVSTTPSLAGISRILAEDPPPVMHIFCHGRRAADTGDTLLYLEREENGGTDPVIGARLIERLGQARQLPQLVFLAACESAVEDSAALGSLAQNLIGELGIPFVVAMCGKVSVSTASALAAAFYTRLLVHGEADRALTEASAGLAERGDILVPALFTRTEETVLFTPPPPLELPTGASPLNLRQLLTATLSLEELELLCADVFEATLRAGRPLRVNLELVGGVSKEARVLRLLRHLERYDALPFLLTAIRNARPDLSAYLSE